MAFAQQAATEHPIAIVSAFFAALSARRTDGVAPALAQFERLEPRVAGLGRHRRSVELELAYLSELSGNYARSREQFLALERLAVPFDPTDRTHLRSRLYHADMLIMDGAFESGARLLLDTYELVGHHAPLDWAELVRHRAHAFRYSLVINVAEDLYLAAQRTAVDAPALAGKLQTNLAETWCWSDAERAVHAAGLSTEINLRLGNRIELAKCDAARGIALAQLGEFVAARDAVSRAQVIAREVGYQAGIAFALQAGAIVEGLAGDRDAALTRLLTLTDVTRRLGTYDHLLAAPAFLSGDEDAFLRQASGVGWLDGEQFVARLRTCLGASA